MSFDLDDEYNIYVQDLQISVGFYKKAFGLHETMRIRSQDEDCIVAFLKSRTSPLVVEIICYNDWQAASALSATGPMLTFTTENYGEAHALHKGMGCICNEDTETPGLYWVKDPDGHLIKVMSAPELPQEDPHHGTAAQRSA
jgi:lactoylglutathione lyase